MCVCVCARMHAYGVRRSYLEGCVGGTAAPSGRRNKLGGKS